MEEIGYIAIIVADSWHMVNGQHFGTIIHDYNSTQKVFDTRMEAINKAYEVLKGLYHNIKLASSKGLQDTYDNELTDYGREIHIISFLLHR